MNITEQLNALPGRWEEEAALADGPRKEALLAKARELRSILSPAPELPPNYHFATDEERKCLPERFKWKRKVWHHWHDAKGTLWAGMAAHPDFDYACPDAPDLLKAAPALVSPQGINTVTGETVQPAPALVTFTDGKPPCRRCYKTECTCPLGTHSPEEWGSPKQLACACGNDLPCPHFKSGPMPCATFTDGKLNPPPLRLEHEGFEIKLTVKRLSDNKEGNE